MDKAYILSVLINLFIGTLTGYILYKIKKRDAKQEEIDRRKAVEETREAEKSEAIKQGLCSLLRDRLLTNCQRYETAGYILPKDLESLSMMYSAYHDLGGNDMITILYKEVVSLPHTMPGGAN